MVIRNENRDSVTWALVLRIALFTVIQGRPGRATFACTEAGGISRVALRLCRVALRLCRVALGLHYGLIIAWPRHGSFEHLKTFVVIAGPPRVSRDHEGPFQGLPTFHHGRGPCTIRYLGGGGGGALEFLPGHFNFFHKRQ